MKIHLRRGLRGTCKLFPEFILDTRRRWEEEGRSLDRCPDFLNLEVSLSTNNERGVPQKNSAAPESLSTECVIGLLSLPMYVANLNTALIGVFPGT